MSDPKIHNRLKLEEEIRSHFNNSEHLNAQKAVLIVGGNSEHEFDVYEAGKVIGGITTSPWKNLTGSNNSGGQDRVATELLWLTLWPGPERRVMILSSKEMADRLLKRWQGSSFPQIIEIFYYDISAGSLKREGILKKNT